MIFIVAITVQCFIDSITTSIDRPAGIVDALKKSSQSGNIFEIEYTTKTIF